MSARAVHVRGERVIVLVVLPVVGVALVVRLLRRALVSSDDGQTAVARVRTASRPTSATTRRQTSKMNINAGHTHTNHEDE